MHRIRAAGITAGVGLIIATLGCILIPAFDEIVYDTVTESVRYENGTDGYDNFVNSSSPTYTYFYLFNLTNADEVNAGNGTIPIVEQIGPYVYKTTKPKEQLTYNEDLSKISYKFRPTYVYDESRSDGDPFTDVVVNVNFIVLGAAKILDLLPGDLGNFFTEATIKNNDTVFEPFIVHDYIWGFEEQTLVDAGLGALATNGLFYEANNTLSDEIVVYTGLSDVDLVNEMDTWKGYDFVIDGGGIRPDGMWGSDYANMLNGSDGTQYKPFVEKDDQLYTFSTDLCRSFRMLYDSEVDVKGINTYRFVIDPENFALKADNIPFCQPDYTNCLPEGMLNVEECYDGVPLVASLPHFYEADPVMQEQIIGLNPVKELHETAIDVEPITGVAVQGNKRLQINFWVQPWRYFPETLKFGNGTVFPIFWLQEQTVISDPDADDYKSEVIQPIELLEILQYVVIGIGAFVMLLGLVLFAIFKSRQSEKSWA